MKEDCLFCKIARKEVPSKILYEDDELMVILDAYPSTDGHTLVIPKKHYEDVYELTDDIQVKLMATGKKWANVLMQKLNKDALTFLFNYGEAQAIKHVHLHLLPDFMNIKKTLTPDETYEILTKE